jgi:hypothetical protein
MFHTVQCAASLCGDMITQGSALQIGKLYYCQICAWAMLTSQTKSDKTPFVIEPMESHYVLAQCATYEEAVELAEALRLGDEVLFVRQYVEGRYPIVACVG